MTTDEKTKIGLIGCGNICNVYFRNLAQFQNTRVVACSDLILERARAKAEEFHVPKACSVEELLQDQEMKLLLT